MKLKKFLVPSVIFLIIVLPWYFSNYFRNDQLLTRYLQIGFPAASIESKVIDNIIQTKVYLHNGIGNWFWYGAVAIVLGTLFFRRKLLAISLFVGIFLLPFAFSSKGHIWHLIPLHPFWIIAFWGFLSILLQKVNRNLIIPIFIILFVWISFGQIKRNWYEIIDTQRYTSDIEILATKSKDFDLPLHLDDDAIPEALFYSDKDRVEKIGHRGALLAMFQSDEEFLLITRSWRIDEEQVKSEQYEVLASDRDKVLVKNIPLK